MKPLKVLNVEDVEGDAELLLLHLRRAGYDVEYKRVQTAETMRDALLAENWDVVISDYQMPNFSGLAALDVLKKTGLDIPFILISGTIGEETAVQAMLAGVNDYMMKDRLARLVPAIERELQEAANRRSKRASEKALRESEARYRDLFENANDTIFTLDLKGNYTSVNKMGEQLTGYSKEEILQLNSVSLLQDPKDVRKVHEMTALKLSSDTQATRYEITLMTKDNQKKIVEISSRVVYENDVPVEIQGIARDITESKKLANDLRESEQRLQLALIAAGMGVWEWNIKTNEIYWSPECYRIMRVEDFPGALSDFGNLLHPDDKEIVTSKAKEAVAKNEIFKAEFRVIDSKNQIIWLTNRAVTEYDADGTPLRMTGTVADITERKRLEQSVRASEERFRALAENNVAGVTLCEADGNLTYVNDAYLKIIGYSREDFERQRLNWYKLTAPEYHEVDEIALNEARKTGSSEAYEKEYIRKDGSRVSVLLANALSAIENREFFISAVLDVTEFKQAESLKREADENFRALVEATTQFVWANDAEGNSFELQSWWEDLTGQPVEEMKDFGWVKMIHPDDREYVRNAWLHSMETKTVYEVVHRVLTVDKEYRYFAARGVPVFDHNGEFRQWIGTFTDITERKKVEEDLRESERRLQLAVSAAKMGIWEWDIASDDLFWSDTNYEIFGRTTPVTKGEDFYEAIHPEDLPGVVEAIRQTLEKNVDYELEFRILRPSGEIRWVHSRGVIAYDEHGKQARCLVVTVDITESKNAQDELLKSEEKLRQAQKLESIGRLAGGIAHDFNNMLTAINGYSDLTLRRLKPDDPIRRNVEEIKEAGERSAALTQQLLAFSRRQLLQPKIVNVNEIVSKTIGLLQRLIGEDIQIISALSSDIKQIKADPGQISQVIMNLAVNSRDAMPQGGTITIETENVVLDEEFVQKNNNLKPGNYVLLAVSDTGMGIDKESLELIFEPFYTTKEVGKGTGLGLATVYGIVNQSGGSISVVSTVDVGTTFEIYFPQIQEEAETKKKGESSEDLLQGKETILLVEDEPVVRRLTCEVLKSYGYKIIEAQDGEEAFEIVTKGASKIDLLLTDMVMPKMGGFELAEKLKNLYPTLRVLFTSGYTENHQLNSDPNVSENNFIQKPYTPESVAMKVREILDAK